MTRPQILTIRYVATALVATAALVLSGCSAGGSSGGPFYKGKTITLLVPYEAGGGTDLAARALAPLLHKHIAGKPKVIVKNEPSTGGIIGANQYAASRDKDGTTILVSSSSLHSSYLVGDPTVKVDFNKLRPVLGMATGSLVFASSETGIEKPQDINKPTDEPLIMAAQVPSGSDLRSLLALDLLGAHYKAIFGYEGSGDKRIAFERGEANLMLDNSISYRDEMAKQVEKGEVVPVFSQGLMVGDSLERVKSLPDLPTPAELYTTLTGKEATGAAWDAYRTLVASTDSLSKCLWLHGDDPDAAYDALTRALDEIVGNKEEFKPLADDVFGGNDPLMGSDLKAVVNSMANPSDEARAYLRDYLKDRWNAEF